MSDADQIVAFQKNPKDLYLPAGFISELCDCPDCRTVHLNLYGCLIAALRSTFETDFRQLIFCQLCVQNKLGFVFEEEDNDDVVVDVDDVDETGATF